MNMKNTNWLKNYYIKYIENYISQKPWLPTWNIFNITDYGIYKQYNLKWHLELVIEIRNKKAIYLLDKRPLSFLER